MILDDIAAKRKDQLNREMAAVPFAEIREQAEKSAPPKNFKSALIKKNLSVIAEVKKGSPSKGLICPDFHPVEIAMEYQAAGADAISVLTENYYFQGSPDYLRQIRQTVSLPILRKDFILDVYQIYEARAMGADAILLIAALLEESELKEYSALARSLGLSCLMEIHNEAELESVLRVGGDLIGINNRNLKTFQIDLATTEKLAMLVPQNCLLVSESGIASRSDMAKLKAAGADAVLIGETLMRSGNIRTVLRELRSGL